MLLSDFASRPVAKLNHLEIVCRQIAGAVHDHEDVDNRLRSARLQLAFSQRWP